MGECRYLEGENVAPRSAAQVRALIGKRVEYLRRADIDHSGRGYIFPKTRKITGQHRSQIEFDDDVYVSYNSIVEMRVLPDQPKEPSHG